MNIEELNAREIIRDCIAKVARGEDRRDASLLRTSFWDDASIDFGVFSGTFDDYLGWVVPGSDAILNTLHTLGQSIIDLRDEQAHAETHVTSYHRANTGDEIRDVVMAGRYLDVIEKRGDQWRILSRRLIYDWSNDWGPSADWSQGIMGLPFQSDNPTGSAHNDASVEFFAR